MGARVLFERAPFRFFSGRGGLIDDVDLDFAGLATNEVVVAETATVGSTAKKLRREFAAMPATPFRISIAPRRCRSC